MGIKCSFGPRLVFLQSGTGTASPSHDGRLTRSPWGRTGCDVRGTSREMPLPRRTGIQYLSAAGTGRFTLLAIFTVHNAEEILMFDGVPLDPTFIHTLHIDSTFFRRDRFALATALLTITVAFMTASVDAGHGRRSGLCAAAAAGALAANGLGHLGRAVAGRAYNPGTASAPALTISALGALRRVRQNEGLSIASVLLAAVAGSAASPPAIAAALAVARAITR